MTRSDLRKLSKAKMLFDFEGPAFKIVVRVASESLIRGCSSAGRAPALHAGCQEFDPPHLHQRDEDVGTANLTVYGRIAQVVRAHA